MKLAALAAIVLVVAGTSAFSPPQRSVRDPGSRSAQSARAVVARYFTALESGRYGEACALLGYSLRAAWAEHACPSLLEQSVPNSPRWSIVDTRALDDGFGVHLRLRQDGVYRVRERERDPARFNTWLAIVGVEDGTQRIVRTRLVG